MMTHEGPVVILWDSREGLVSGAREVREPWTGHMQVRMTKCSKNKQLAQNSEHFRSLVNALPAWRLLASFRAMRDVSMFTPIRMIWCFFTAGTQNLRV